jgi:hypothetical protein
LYSISPKKPTGQIQEQNAFPAKRARTATPMSMAAFISLVVQL